MPTCFFLIFFPILLFAHSWAEQTLAELTLEEKIGQLFVAPACPMRGEDHRRDWKVLFDTFHIGNAIVKQSDPITQVKFLNELQEKSRWPLLIAADAEWGLAMRMKDTMAFPRNRTLGAVSDRELIYAAGMEIGRQAKRVGIHLNLAPVADVNTNPANPIIGMRSFGEDPKRVAEWASAMASGMESSGILASLKHFPGHGDTSVDSHKGLPVVTHSRKRLNAVEFVPFRKAIEEGIGAILTAHLLVPAIDPDNPATLSSKCLTGILRKEWGFDGLIVSDALNMEALLESPETVAVKAFAAGCDLLLYGDHIAPHIDKLVREDVPRAWKALKKGFDEGILSLDQLDASVARILAAKERMGLHVSRKVSEEGLDEALHTFDAMRLKRRLFQEAVVLHGDLKALPKNTAYVSIGVSDEIAAEFSSVFHVAPDLGASDRIKLSKELKEFDSVVIGVHKWGPRDQNYGFSSDCLALIRSMPNSTLCLFGTPYAMGLFSHPGPLLIGFENDSDAQTAVLDILQGRANAIGDGVLRDISH